MCANDIRVSLHEHHLRIPRVTNQFHADPPPEITITVTSTLILTFILTLILTVTSTLILTFILTLIPTLTHAHVGLASRGDHCRRALPRRLPHAQVNSRYNS